MRKYIIGILIGAVLMFSAQAGAATMLGSKVSKVYNVKLNGKDIGSSPVIGGVTYAPLRTLANELELNINRQGDMVELTTPAIEPVDEIVDDPTDTESSTKIQDRIVEIDSRIASLKDSIESVTRLLEDRPWDDTMRAFMESNIELYKAKLTILEAQKAELEAQQ